jgi:hypothetical protein
MMLIGRANEERRNLITIAKQQFELFALRQFFMSVAAMDYVAFRLVGYNGYRQFVLSSTLSAPLV